MHSSPDSAPREQGVPYWVNGQQIIGVVGARLLSAIPAPPGNALHLGPFQLLVHPDDVVLRLQRLFRSRSRSLRVLRFLHAILRYLLVDFDVSHDQNFP